VKTAQDQDKYIVRISMINSFFLCTTRSSDGTHPKFDFEDPEQCQICAGYNPFIEEPIPGEELENDKEPSKDSEDEEKDDKKEGDKEGDENNGGFRFKTQEGDEATKEDAEKEEDGKKV